MKRSSLNIIVAALTLFLVFILILFCLIYSKEPVKIGVIRSAYLVENYKGMMEANALLSTRIKTWSTNLDTLQKDLELAMSIHHLTLVDLEKKDAGKLPLEVKTAKETYEKYYQVMNDRILIEKEKLVQGALNQMNTQIGNYAKAHHYQIIIGQLAAGNILYAENSIDVTEDVLRIINQEFDGQ